MGRTTSYDSGKAVHSALPSGPHQPERHMPESVENFTLAWDLSPTHAYNLKAADLFTSSLIAKYPTEFSEIDRPEIRAAFLTHIRYLFRIKQGESNPSKKKHSLQYTLDSRRRRRATVINHLGARSLPPSDNVFVAFSDQKTSL